MNNTRWSHAPSGFFVFRTPLLPFDEITRFSEGLEAREALDEPGRLKSDLAADRTRLRERLRRLIARPEIREAVFLASPDLNDALKSWYENPDGERGRRAERSLVRYISRMASRPTPFGLFAGTSVGALGAATALVTEAQSAYTRHTRLDMDYLLALTDALAAEPQVRSSLTYVPNSSLYRAAGRIWYVEARWDSKSRTYHLVAVDETPRLRSALDLAASGIGIRDLADTMATAGVGVARLEAFVGALIDNQILVPDLAPCVTGPEAIHPLIERLQGQPEPARILEHVRDDLKALDIDGLGADPARYAQMAASLGALPAKPELNHLFQVDLMKPAPGATLGAAVVDEIRRGMEILHRIAKRPADTELARFMTAFQTRYGQREVPLCEALDDEAGIGFGQASGWGSDPSPLLKGAEFSGVRDDNAPFGTRDAVLLRKLTEALRSAADEIVLSDSDLNHLRSGNPPPLPDAFVAAAVVAASSSEALASGDFRVLLSGADGPSGARLLGRFCHIDERLRQEVEAHLRAEEALRPEAVFAEVVHLPEGRHGNVISRPVLRDYEIPYLGRSGAPVERQIPVTDLLVSVRGRRVVLRSERLGREVIPRLTSAHNHAFRSLAVYRFLCSLPSQGITSALQWDWGPLAGSRFLPRVRCGRVVLSRMSWQLETQGIGDRGEGRGREAGGGRREAGEKREAGRDRAAGDERREAGEKREAGSGREAGGDAEATSGSRDDESLFIAVQEWRRRHGLPRMVQLVDADNTLTVDFDNILSIESFVHLVKSRPEVTLQEVFPGPDELIARGPEGSFVHEIFALFVRSDEASVRNAAPAKRSMHASPVVHSSRRSPPASRPLPSSLAPLPCLYPPGSEWLYAKLYTGRATADQVLQRVVEPVVRGAMDSGAADRWFFIRFGDPDWHLRVRLHGAPERLWSEVLPALHRLTDPLLDDASISRVQLDTYEPEIARYGGSAGIELAEYFFWRDSEAVLAIIALLDRGGAGLDERWRLTLRGMDLLLDDLGFDLEARNALVQEAREGSLLEFGPGTGLKAQLGRKYRKERAALEALLDPASDAESPLEPGFDILRRRSEALSPVFEELKRREATGGLSAPIAELAPAFLHMHANRLLRSSQRAHEAVLYDYLGRLYESRVARGR